MSLKGAIINSPRTIRQALKAARYNRLFKPMPVDSKDKYLNSSVAKRASRHVASLYRSYDR